MFSRKPSTDTPHPNSNHQLIKHQNKQTQNMEAALAKMIKDPTLQIDGGPATMKTDVTIIGKVEGGNNCCEIL